MAELMEDFNEEELYEDENEIMAEEEVEQPGMDEGGAATVAAGGAGAAEGAEEAEPLP